MSIDSYSVPEGCTLDCGFVYQLRARDSQILEACVNGERPDATNFFTVKSGRIKIATYGGDGREFVQGYFVEG